MGVLAVEVDEVGAELLEAGEWNHPPGSRSSREPARADERDRMAALVQLIAQGRDDPLGAGAHSWRELVGHAGGGIQIERVPGWGTLLKIDLPYEPPTSAKLPLGLPNSPTWPEVLTPR